MALVGQPPAGRRHVHRRQGRRRTTDSRRSTPATGALDPYVNIQLTGHHNYGRVARRGERPRRRDLDRRLARPDPRDRRRQLHQAADGAASYTRDQIVNINLRRDVRDRRPELEHQRLHTRLLLLAPTTPTSATSAGRRTAPTSSFGDRRLHGGSFQDCDSASRFDASSTGSTSSPPGSTTPAPTRCYSVAVTSSAVYVGGHYRWLNNPYGQDRPAAGAVPRPGLAALDPANGVPLSWNPGRNPRGHGAEVVYATATGVWVGSDTD